MKRRRVTFAPVTLTNKIHSGNVNHIWNTGTGSRLFIGSIPGYFELAELESVGCNQLFSLLQKTPHYLERMLTDAPFTVYRLPLEDHAAPSKEDADLAVKRLDELLANGDVYLHCYAGLGRTGVIAGCFLKSHGIDTNEVFRRLCEARGPQCPETQAQRDFLRAYVPAPRGI